MSFDVLSMRTTAKTMKSRLMSITALIVLLIVMNPGYVLAENLLSDGGFEKNPTEWLNLWGTGAGSVSTQFVRTGRQSGKVSLHEVPAGWLRIIKGLEPETLYRVKAYCYRANEAACANLLLHAANPPFHRDAEGEKTTKTGTWEPITAELATKENRVLYIHLETTGTGDVWFDDVSLVALKTKEEREAEFKAVLNSDTSTTEDIALAYLGLSGIALLNQSTQLGNAYIAELTQLIDRHPQLEKSRALDVRTEVADYYMNTSQYDLAIPAIVAAARINKQEDIIAAYHSPLAKAIQHADKSVSADELCRSLRSELVDFATLIDDHENMHTCAMLQFLMATVLCESGYLDKALLETIILLEIAYPEILPNAYEIVMKIAKTEKENSGIATDVFSFYKYGRAGIDTLAGTDDDLRNPLHSVNTSGNDPRSLQFSQAIQKLPETWEGHLQRAILYRLWGRPAEGLREVVAAYNLCPTDQDALQSVSATMLPLLAQVNEDPTIGNRFVSYRDQRALEVKAAAESGDDVLKGFDPIALITEAPAKRIDDNIIEDGGKQPGVLQPKLASMTQKSSVREHEDSSPSATIGKSALAIEIFANMAETLEKRQQAIDRLHLSAVMAQGEKSDIEHTKSFRLQLADIIQEHALTSEAHEAFAMLARSMKSKDSKTNTELALTWAEENAAPSAQRAIGYSGAYHSYLEGNYDAALQHADSQLQRYPSDIGEVLMLKALCRIKMNMNEDARDHLQELIRASSNPELVQRAYFLMAWTNLNEREDDQARKHLNLLLERYPTGEYSQRATDLLAQLAN